MQNRWVGPLVTIVIVAGIGMILFVNLQSPPGATSNKPVAPAGQEPPKVPALKPAGFREHPIGEEVLKNHMRIAAVWLPPIQMDGTASLADTDIIHIEADVRATEGNPNGFAKDEFVPYMNVTYKITPVGSDKPIDHGNLIPMVASDGLHYGASIVMPKAGEYRLTYAFQPPQSGGLGRHSDPVTGVAPWWEPFEATFDWDCPGPSEITKKN